MATAFVLRRSEGGLRGCGHTAGQVRKRVPSASPGAERRRVGSATTQSRAAALLQPYLLAPMAAGPPPSRLRVTDGDPPHFLSLV